jgi:DNA-binding NarL/FixJ family response regulator
MKPIRILVVDDHACLRDGLCSLLEDADGFEIAGETGSDAGVTAVVVSCQPDLIVLDFDAAPDGGGFVVLEGLSQLGYHGRVVVLSLRDGPALRAKAEACGAGAFLDKGIAPDELLHVLRTMAGHLGAGPLDDPPLPHRAPGGAARATTRRVA